MLEGTSKHHDALGKEEENMRFGVPGISPMVLRLLSVR
jgi:hypothetical protein